MASSEIRVCERHSNGWLIIWSLLLVLVFAVAVGLFGKDAAWYSPSLPHRLQTEALLKGHICLSEVPDDLDFDLVWFDGRVQQVWGLGVPVLRLPFEAAARIVNVGFPDRVVFALAFWAVCILSVTTWRSYSFGTLERGGTVVAVGAFVVCFAFPPLLSLCLTRFHVYEETVAYATVYAVGFVIAIVRSLKGLSRLWWFLLCVAVGFAPFVRPTLGICAALTIILVGVTRFCCSAQAKIARRHLLFDTIGGVGILCALGVLLLWTNYIRFGSPLEFGHSLNVQHEQLVGSMYSTRFDYPFQKEPLPSATRELLGALFLGPRTNNGMWYAPTLFSGQSETTRWRDFYFRTYDLSTAVMLVISWGVGLIRLLTTVRLRQVPHITSLLTVFSILTTACLFVFYLRCPVISSRYLLDFAPGFIAAGLALWLEVTSSIQRAEHTHKYLILAFGLLILWTGFEISKAFSSGRRPDSISWKELLARRSIPPKSVPPDVDYSSFGEVGQTRIPFNGTGWRENGLTAPLVVLFVFGATGLKLTCVTSETLTAEMVKEQVRAKIGLEFLDLTGIEKRNSEWHLTFQRKTKGQGLEVAFVTFGTNREIARPLTKWRLVSVRWHTTKDTGWP